MMDEVEVRVGLPRFKMEEKYDLKKILTSMGMVDAFDMTQSDFSGRDALMARVDSIDIYLKSDPSSNLSSKLAKLNSIKDIALHVFVCSLFPGMSPANNLLLSKVIHKAFVEVNEEGTEAAAATAAVMMLRCAMISPTFVTDHPFLFFIRHNPTMSILFAGRYCSPE